MTQRGKQTGEQAAERIGTGQKAHPFSKSHGDAGHDAGDAAARFPPAARAQQDEEYRSDPGWRDPADVKARKCEEQHGAGGHNAGDLLRGEDTQMVELPEQGKGAVKEIGSAPG